MRHDRSRVRPIVVHIALRSKLWLVGRRRIVNMSVTRKAATLTKCLTDSHGVAHVGLRPEAAVTVLVAVEQRICKA